MSVLDDLFGGIKSLGSLAPTAAAWKELIDPVKAVQQPTLGTAASTPIIQPPPAGTTISKTPGATLQSNPMVWLGVGAFALVLIFMVGRR